MAPIGESSIGESSKISENSENSTAKCGQCKKSVKDKLCCKKCKVVFHPSCMIAANRSRNNVCTHEHDERQDMVDKLISEIELLKRIINEQEEKFKLLQENKDLLVENNKLLRENNEYLQEKNKEKIARNEAGSKSGTKNELIKRQEKLVNKPTRKEDIGNEPEIQKHYKSSTVIGENKKDLNQKIPEIQTQSNLTQEVMSQKGEDENEPWRVKSKRKSNSVRNKPLFYGTSTEGTVKGLPRRIWFFVSRLSPEMTEQDLRDMLEQKCPNGSIVVEKQKLYQNYQSAFKVGIPVELETLVSQANFWPKDSRINKFNFFLVRRKTQQAT